MQAKQNKSHREAEIAEGTGAFVRGSGLGQGAEWGIGLAMMPWFAGEAGQVKESELRRYGDHVCDCVFIH